MEKNNMYEENVPFFESQLIEKGVPPLTRWRKLRGLLSCFWVTETDQLIRFSHFQLKIYPYLIEVFVIIVTYLIFLKFYFPSLPENNDNEHHIFFALKKFQFYFMGYIWLTGLSCLIYSHIKDPGYLPFYFPAIYYNQDSPLNDNKDTNKNSDTTTYGRKKFTLNELRSGTAIYAEQIDWAREQRRPERVRFSAATGYYVIRGDHICQYINNWVGLYNHRWFIIAIVYIILYILDYIFVYTYTKFVTHTVNPPKFMTPILLLIGLPFLFLLGNNLFNQCISISLNLTLLNMFRKDYVNYSRGSCLNNWEDVFGPKKFLLCWFLPVPLPLISDGFDYHARPDPDNPFRNYEYESNTNTQIAVATTIQNEKDENNQMFNPLAFISPTRNRNL